MRQLAHGICTSRSRFLAGCIRCHGLRALPLMVVIACMQFALANRPPHGWVHPDPTRRDWTAANLARPVVAADLDGNGQEDEVRILLRDGQPGFGVFAFLRHGATQSVVKLMEHPDHPTTYYLAAVRPGPHRVLCRSAETSPAQALCRIGTLREQFDDGSVVVDVTLERPGVLLYPDEGSGALLLVLHDGTWLVLTYWR